MPCVIRSEEESAPLVELLPDSWHLPEQVDALEAWLVESARELTSGTRWIADIGFCPREDAAGGGSVISTRLMRLCLDANVEVWLSEYPGTA